MPPSVAVVTDSTAYLPPVPGVTVVDVQVLSARGPSPYGPGRGNRTPREQPSSTAGTPDEGVSNGKAGPADKESAEGKAGPADKESAEGKAGPADKESAAGKAGPADKQPADNTADFADPADRIASNGKVGPADSKFVIGQITSVDERSFTGDLATATTSRPAPARFAACYAALAAAGATGIVSIHLSGELSGTIESARAAAKDAPIPVQVIDSRSIAMGLGYPVLAAARAAARGASLESVVSAATRCMTTTRTFFYVETLEYLRRSGRIGTAASLVGSALMIKPLLHITDGRIALLEKVRTASRAIARLEDLAVQAAGEGPVEIAVQHLGAAPRAEALAERLPKRLAGLVELRVVEVGAVIGAHVGPGMLGLTVTTCDH